MVHCCLRGGHGLAIALSTFLLAESSLPKYAPCRAGSVTGGLQSCAREAHADVTAPDKGRRSVAGGLNRPLGGRASSLLASNFNSSDDVRQERWSLISCARCSTSPSNTLVGIKTPLIFREIQESNSKTQNVSRNNKSISFLSLYFSFLI
jgi:hypothetical protein